MQRELLASSDTLLKYVGNRRYLACWENTLAGEGTQVWRASPSPSGRGRRRVFCGAGRGFETQHRVSNPHPALRAALSRRERDLVSRRYHRYLRFHRGARIHLYHFSPLLKPADVLRIHVRAVRDLFTCESLFAARRDVAKVIPSILGRWGRFIHLRAQPPRIVRNERHHRALIGTASRVDHRAAHLSCRESDLQLQHNLITAHRERLVDRIV